MTRVSATRRMWVATVATLAACGGGGKAATERAAPPAEAGSELTAFQQENGIGPVVEPVVLGPYDAELAAAGKEVFTVKCTACHKVGERYVGPDLAGVTERRTAAYVMNMILNPQEMYEQHPVAKGLLAEYLTYMPNQGLTRDQARAVVEYLRQAESSEE